MSDQYEHLTDTELARDIYLAIIANDDKVSDTIDELYRPALKMAEALWARLRGPYCREDGCRNEHMESFPWCPWHRPEGWDPLPPDFPPNPNPMPGADR